MSVHVRIPEFLRSHVSGSQTISASGADVGALIADLDAQFPGLAGRLVDESGLRRYINVYINGRDIRFGAGIATAVADGDSVWILPASSGGMAAR